jgi:hypothetical protein
VALVAFAVLLLVLVGLIGLVALLIRRRADARDGGPPVGIGHHGAHPGAVAYDPTADDGARSESEPHPDDA